MTGREGATGALDDGTAPRPPIAFWNRPGGRPFVLTDGAGSSSSNATSSSDGAERTTGVVDDASDGRPNEADWSIAKSRSDMEISTRGSGGVIGSSIGLIGVSTVGVWTVGTASRRGDPISVGSSSMTADGGSRGVEDLSGSTGGLVGASGSSTGAEVTIGSIGVVSASTVGSFSTGDISTGVTAATCSTIGNGDDRPTGDLPTAFPLIGFQSVGGSTSTPHFAPIAVISSRLYETFLTSAGRHVTPFEDGTKSGAIG